MDGQAGLRRLMVSASLIEVEIAKRTAPLLETLQKRGYEVYSPKDYATITALTAETGRAGQTPMLSIARNDFTRGDAFWLFLMKDGKAMGGCAARLYDLKGETFEPFIRRTSQQQYQRSSDPILSVAPPAAEDLSGRLIYMGEMELHEDARGDFNMLSAFFRLLQAVAAIKWPDFDWMYAFVPKEHKRIIDYYGFNLRIPNALTWADPEPPGRLSTHLLVAIKRSHFEHIWSIPD